MAASQGAPPAVGIDLGTTYCCVATIQHRLPNTDRDYRKTPSCVAFSESDILVGYDAKEEFPKNPTNTVFDGKRLLGKQFSEESVQSDLSRWPFRVVEDDDGMPMFSVTYKGREETCSPEKISSMLLKKMKEIAEAYVGSAVTKAVITVPLIFGKSQLEATKRAAVMADLDVLCLLAEPVAAAIAYGLHNRDTEEKNILIFDLGGGTCDVSLLGMSANEYKVRASAEDMHLGGEDFDNKMVMHFIEEFKKKHKKDISEDPKAVRRLKAECEKAKITLSSTSETDVYVECLYEGIDFNTTITRAKFDQLNMDLFEKCISLVEKCLMEARMDRSNLDEVVLVGGSTQILRIQDMLQEFFYGKILCKSTHPGEAIAEGAALVAESILNGEAAEGLQDLFVPPVQVLIDNNPGAQSDEIEETSNILKTVHDRGNRRAMVSEFKFNHPAGHNFMWMEGAKGSYTCDGCKQGGYGPRYCCQNCSDEFNLHEDCLNVSAEAFHELTGQNFKFLDKPRSKHLKQCNACGRNIDRFAYLNQCGGMALHPLCFNLKAELSVDGVDFKLISNEGLRKKCNICGKKKLQSHVSDGQSAWFYKSKDGKYWIHGFCASQILEESKECEEDQNDFQSAWFYKSKDGKYRIHGFCASQILEESKECEEDRNDFIMKKLEEGLSKRKKKKRTKTPKTWKVPHSWLLYIKRFFSHLKILPGCPGQWFILVIGSCPKKQKELISSTDSSGQSSDITGFDAKESKEIQKELISSTDPSGQSSDITGFDAKESKELMSSMATGSSSSDISALPRKKYDVFLSYREDKDTQNKCKSFSDRLFDALQRNGISTFKNDKEHRKGKDHTPYFSQAVKEYHVAVVVLSENYASSTSCLEELLEIIECKKKNELVVLPIFYRVDPSHVREYKGSIGQALATHEGQVDRGKIESWKSALTQVASLSGWYLQDRNVSSTIRAIMVRLSHLLKGTYSSQTKGPDQVDFMGLWANNRPGKVCFIGIWGEAGIGKSTFAMRFYKRNFDRYEASCFLADVGECSKSTNGLIRLQEKLLFDTLQRPGMTLESHKVGKELIGQRLSSKKVLVVLDDVDALEQLEALVGSPHWFGSGSRIVVITRDKHLLLDHGFLEENMYQMKPLDHEEALSVFCLEAFKTRNPEKEYINLCESFAFYARGNPLSLKVLGSLLHSKRTNKWVSMLKELKEVPRVTIRSILKMSYDDLGTLNKIMFLDIACFFKGWEIERVTQIFESCDLLKDDDLSILEKMSLISYVKNTLWMSQVIQDVAKGIVLEECHKRPQKRSRLWLQEDIRYVLEHNKGTNQIEGIFMDDSLEKMTLSKSGLSEMKRLRILKLNNVDLPQGLEYLSNELRILVWYDYPLASMPPSFQPTNLVELNMRGGRIQRFWTIHEKMEKLSRIDLRHSNLTICPDFSWMPNLRWLSLRHCSKLKQVHPSVATLKMLTHLDLSYCGGIKTLTGGLDLESLQELDLSFCSKLIELPEFTENMGGLLKLYVSGTPILKLPQSIGKLTGLVLLDMSYCKNVASLPDTLIKLKSIKSLLLTGCARLKELPQNLEGLESLEELDVRGTVVRPKKTCCTS